MANERLPHRRIRGPRWLVFRCVGDMNLDEESYESLGLCKSQEFAEFQARELRGMVVALPADEAQLLVRRGVRYDPTTLADLAREGSVSRDAMRRALRRGGRNVEVAGFPRRPGDGKNVEVAGFLSVDPWTC